MDQGSSFFDPVTDKFSSAFLLTWISFYLIFEKKMYLEVCPRHLEKPSKNCNKIDLSKYYHPESPEFEFPAPWGYKEIDKMHLI